MNCVAADEAGLRPIPPSDHGETELTIGDCRCALASVMWLKHRCEVSGCGAAEGGSVEVRSGIPTQPSPEEPGRPVHLLV